MLVELVRDLLVRTGVGPRCSGWVSPKPRVAHDLDVASRVVVALDRLGVGVALRDFGSVVSSLEQLRLLPAPTITIAGPLVAAVRDSAALGARDPGDRSPQERHEDASTTLLAAIVRYARALGRVVVAFDVYDDAHARRLRDLGCDLATGPAFGPPIRPDEVEVFLTERLSGRRSDGRR